MEPSEDVPPGGPYEQALSVSFHGETQEEAFDKAWRWLSASRVFVTVLDVSWRVQSDQGLFELRIYFHAE